MGLSRNGGFNDDASFGGFYCGGFSILIAAYSLVLREFCFI